MKTIAQVLFAALAATGCSVQAGSSDVPLEPFKTGTAKQQEVVAPSVNLLPQDAVKQTFKLTSANARSLVPAGKIGRRSPGGRITTASLARIQFAATDDGSFMRGAAERMLSSAAAPASAIHSLQARKDEGLVLLPLSDGVAYSVPESGTFTLRRPFAAERATVLQSSEDAVDAALAGIAKYRLLALGPQESLDVLGVSAAFHTTTGDNGPVGSGDKVGYQVLLGRSYRGTQVLGPPTLVALDADGEIATFRKGWRDITGESGALDIAEDTKIEARRDKLMVRFLALKESSCGYTEDQDPGMVQAAAGAGCHYVYSDPDAREALNREVDDWVNAANDPSIPMRGVKKGAAAAQ